MPVECTCFVCGRPVIKRPYRVKPRNFCSRDCRLRANLEPLVLNPDGLTANVPLWAKDGSIKAYALIDAADIEFVGRRRWSLGSRGYAVASVKINGRGTQVCLHRELLGLKIGDPREADHLNRDRLDNRRANLRILSGSENAQNRSKKRGSASQHRGVCWSKELHKWRVRVQLPGGKRVLIGDFADELEAAEAARAARLRLLPYAVD